MNYNNIVISFFFIFQTMVLQEETHQTFKMTPQLKTTICKS